MTDFINTFIQSSKLDSIFLSAGNEFKTQDLIVNGIVLKQEESDSLERETNTLNSTVKRLKQYVDSIKDQIVAIVDQESEEFLEVAAKIDGFKSILDVLKESMDSCHSYYLN